MDAGFDQLEIELFKNAIFSIADEMAATIVRTAYSTVVRDNMDFSTAITNGKGEVVAQGLTLAGHLGSIPVAIRHIMAKFGDRIYPEDIIVLNDPYSGGMHLPDIFVFRPVFAGEELVAFAASVCHHSDVGGRVPGSNAADSTEIFQEGVRISPMKLYERGEPNETLMELLRQNVRMPDQLFGDLRAQMAAARVAERRIFELCDSYGTGKAQRYLSDIIDYAERMTRAAIATLPDGEFAFQDWIDDDGVVIGVPVLLKVRITKKGQKITVDWTGSSPQVAGAINATQSFTQAASYCAIRSILNQPIPENEGMFRCIDVVVPKGTVLNVDLPGACAARGLTGFRMLDCLFGALAQMAPEIVYAGSDGGLTGLSIGGYRADRSPFVYVEFSGASWGGRPHADGPDGISNLLSNVCLPSVEVIEQLQPLQVWAAEFVPDTGGAGKYRGGAAVRREYRLTEDKAILQCRVDRRTFQPYGLYGGKPGASSMNVMAIEDGAPEVMPGKATLNFARGQRFGMTTAGGGGWGDPLERDPMAVFIDYEDEYVSAEAALADYGVVLGPKGPDLEATAALRAERRAGAPKVTSFVTPEIHAA
ncbi:MAG TPA: hydantoinase B/oxoprolinase family protein [Rhizobiaceae bacterium]|nr:hydantoinase B/oxoprolinase family protein [Rhizobiaceae bacterium]